MYIFMPLGGEVTSLVVHRKFSSAQCLKNECLWDLCGSFKVTSRRTDYIL